MKLLLYCLQNTEKCMCLICTVLVKSTLFLCSHNVFCAKLILQCMQLVYAFFLSTRMVLNFLKKEGYWCCLVIEVLLVFQSLAFTAGKGEKIHIQRSRCFYAYYEERLICVLQAILSPWWEGFIYESYIFVHFVSL